MEMELDRIAPLVGDSTTDTDTHILSDIGETWSALSTWLYRQI